MEASYYKNVEYLWAILEQLNREEKIELAARLMGAVRPGKSKKKEDDEGWKKLYGAWTDDAESAEDLMKFIKENRNVNRQIEPLD